MYKCQVEGYQIPRWFLQVDTQPEVGEEAYDKGAKILSDFFMRCPPPPPPPPPLKSTKFLNFIHLAGRSLTFAKAAAAWKTMKN